MTFAVWPPSSTKPNRHSCRSQPQTGPRRYRPLLELLEERAVPAALTVDDVYVTNEDTALNVSAPGVLTNDLSISTGSWSATMVDIDPAGPGSLGSATDGINSIVEAKAVLAAALAASPIPGQTVTTATGTYAVTSYVTGFSERVIDYTLEGVFGTNNNYPNGFGGVGSTHFLVAASADILLKAGDYTIAVGSDEGAELTLTNAVTNAPINFIAQFNVDGDASETDNTITYNSPRCYDNTFGQFTLASDTVVHVSALFFEEIEEDGFEISIANSHQATFSVPTFRLLGEGAYEARMAPVVAPPLTVTEVNSSGLLTGTTTGGGTVSMNANGSFTYTPAANFFGTDTFTYTAETGVDSETLNQFDVRVYQRPDMISLAAADDARANGTLVGVGTRGRADMLDTGPGGNFGVNNSIPGLDPEEIPPSNNFAVFSTGFLRVNNPGYYAFGVFNEDGSRLRIDLNKDGDFDDPGELIINRDVVDSTQPLFLEDVPVTDLTAGGDYAFEWTWFENQNNGEAELFYAPAPLMTVPTFSTSTYVLVGNSSNGISVLTKTFKQTDTATVSITVNDVNDAPVCVDDSNSTTQGVEVSGNVLANDFDPDNSDTSSGNPAENDDDLDAILVSGPSNGTLNLNPETGYYTYTPDTLFFGMDSFTYKVEDSNGATSGVCTVTITVTPAGTGVHTVADSCLGGTALLIIGTTGNDSINVGLGTVSGTLSVSFNGTVTSHTAPTGRIIVIGDSGDDHIEIASNVMNQGWLYGDAGNDHIDGGDGGSLIFGGEGTDELLGGSGRDVMVGGEGADRLIGNANDDILIAGLTTMDNRTVGHEDFWCNILKEWNSTNTFQQRLYHLSSGHFGTDGGTALNNGSFLDCTTLLDDGETDDIDLLQGSSGQDWLIFLSGEDRVNGQNP